MNKYLFKQDSFKQLIYEWLLFKIAKQIRRTRENTTERKWCKLFIRSFDY